MLCINLLGVLLPNSCLCDRNYIQVYYWAVLFKGLVYVSILDLACGVYKHATKIEEAPERHSHIRHFEDFEFWFIFRVQCQYEAWPIPFSLSCDLMDRTVLQVLQNGQVVDARQRTRLIDFLFLDISKYTLWVTSCTICISVIPLSPVFVKLIRQRSHCYLCIGWIKLVVNPIDAIWWFVISFNIGLMGPSHNMNQRWLTPQLWISIIIYGYP